MVYVLLYIQRKNGREILMEKVKKKLGFGCMRLPMQNGKVDTVEFSKISLFFRNQDQMDPG